MECKLLLKELRLRFSWIGPASWLSDIHKVIGMHLYWTLAPVLTEMPLNSLSPVKCRKVLGL